MLYTQGFARIRCTVVRYTLEGSHAFAALLCIILDFIALKVIFLEKILRNASQKSCFCSSRNRCNLLIRFMFILLVTNDLLVPHLILLYLAAVFYF